MFISANSLAQSLASTQQTIYEDHKVFPLSLIRAAYGQRCLKGPGWFWTHPMKGDIGRQQPPQPACAENLVLRAQHIHEVLITLLRWTEHLSDEETEAQKSTLPKTTPASER